MVWHGEELVGFGLVTTGTGPPEARLGTAPVAGARGGRAVRLTGPDARLPAGATRAGATR